MRVPLSWLKDYVEFDDTPGNLAERLTFSGTEVEAVETVGGEYPGLVAAEVLESKPHPHAPGLTVCRVNSGTATLQVVCGAPEVLPGHCYAYAPPGTALPDGTAVATRTLKGIDSHGMLLAEDELGLSPDHSTLLDLGPASPGTPLAEILGPPETVFHLEITPNRPDCLSIIGIAREVAALYGTELRLPGFDLTESARAVEDAVRVSVADPSDCPRYTARVVENVRIRPAPLQMRRRLALCGIRPINNIVDVTNYVLLECGQPLHAFDLELLEGRRLAVRRAGTREAITTLDGEQRDLPAGILTICDDSGPVAVAGVMGGANSQIRSATRTVVIESAFFAPALIRSAARALGLSTESSYRFERGVDPAGVEWASRRAAALIKDLAGGEILRGVLDIYPHPVGPRHVSCRWEAITNLLGVKAGPDEIAGRLAALGLEITERTPRGCTVSVPSRRRDIEREVDLAEEFARLHGLDRIPEPPPRSLVVPDADDTHTRATFALRARLVGLGLREVNNYSLVSPRLLDTFRADDPSSRIILPHPVSHDQSVLRTTLIPQMVVTLGRNHARQAAAHAALFEIGRTFSPGKEEDRLVLGLMGPAGRPPLDRRRAVTIPEMFLWLKGILEALLPANNPSRPWGLSPADIPFLTPGTAMQILVHGQSAGTAGILAPNIAAEWRFAGPVAVAEITLEPLLEDFRRIPSFSPPAQYPAIQRDVAVIVNESVKHEDVLRVIRAAAPKELASVELFDIFKGEAIGSGKKSMAYSLQYRSAQRTLTDEEANAFHAAVIEALRRELAAVVRES